MRIHAISDLHLGARANREALLELTPRPDDWLILGGDVGEREEHLELALRIVCSRFAGVVWVPGNHELWTTSREPGTPRGVEKYHRMVALCRRYEVMTPEDGYPEFETEDGPITVAPLFLLYDYSFAPDGMGPPEAIAWAAEEGIECADESYLYAEPFADCAAWCRARVRWTQSRLGHLDHDRRLILVNHYPLRRDLAYTPAIPRFIPWCGTRATESWHLRYNVRAVIFGHVHIRRTEWRDGVRFEEVSLGYPRQWDRSRGIDHYVREVWPADGLGIRPDDEIVWHR